MGTVKRIQVGNSCEMVYLSSVTTGYMLGEVVSSWYDLSIKCQFLVHMFFHVVKRTRIR